MAQLGRPVRAFFADVTTATARVQAPEECGVVAQAGQGCCGRHCQVESASGTVDG